MINKNQKIIILDNKKLFYIHYGAWGLGIGDWGLGIGDWAE